MFGNIILAQLRWYSRQLQSMDSIRACTPVGTCPSFYTQNHRIANLFCSINKAKALALIGANAFLYEILRMLCILRMTNKHF